MSTRGARAHQPTAFFRTHIVERADQPAGVQRRGTVRLGGRRGGNPAPGGATDSGKRFPGVRSRGFDPLPVFTFLGGAMPEGGGVVLVANEKGGKCSTI